MKHLKNYNESIRHLLKPKPEDQMKKELDKLKGDEKIDMAYKYDLSHLLTNQDILDSISYLNDWKKFNIACKNNILWLVKYLLKNNTEYNDIHYVINIGRSIARRLGNKEVYEFLDKYIESSPDNKIKMLNESIRHLLKAKDEVSKNIEIRDNIYKQQHKCKYDILKFLESIGFKFDYPIKSNSIEELGWFDKIGSILIMDFIKEHKKIIPNFNRLSYNEQNEQWDNSINNIIKPKIEEILNQFDFKLNSDGMKYGQGDLLLEFSTPYDDILKFSKNNYKIVSDKFLKK